MHKLAIPALLMVGTTLLAGCVTDAGTLFSASGVDSGSAGQEAVAGSESGGEPSAAGADNGGAGKGGTPSAGGSKGAAGSASAGAASAGAPGAGAPSMGGTGGSPPAPDPSVCDGKTVPMPDPLIANFESGVAGWSAYVGNDPYGVDSTQPGATSTEHALRFMGGKAQTSGFYDLLPCHDVSAFDGLQFWAKGKGGDKIRFLAVVPATDPKPEIGDCHEPEMKCSDHPGMAFTLTDEWKLYRAPWASLSQLGWGSKGAYHGVINAILWINDGPVEKFDFSIDEVTLFKNASGG